MAIGLFGVTMQAVSKRAKEVSVRKVLGASLADIVKLLSKEYVLQISLAVLLVIPLAYIIMENWLNNFAYRVDQSWHTYLFGVAVITLIVMLTISWQLIKAAIRNPVDAIRHE